MCVKTACFVLDSTFDPEEVTNTINQARGFTMNNLLDIISILAFLISVYLLVDKIISSRVSIDLKVLNFKVYDNVEAQFLIMFENRSNLSISITGIHILGNNTLYSCYFQPRRVKESTRRINNEVIERLTTSTLALPINLTPLGGTTGYISFRDGLEDLVQPEKILNLQVDTNRGRVKKSLLLPIQVDFLRNI